MFFKIKLQSLPENVWNITAPVCSREAFFLISLVYWNKLRSKSDRNYSSIDFISSIKHKIHVRFFSREQNAKTFHCQACSGKLCSLIVKTLNIDWSTDRSDGKSLFITRNGSGDHFLILITHLVIMEVRVSHKHSHNDINKLCLKGSPSWCSHFYVNWIYVNI